MALDVWNQQSGYSFGVFQESTNINLPLPVNYTTGVTFTIISGKLPAGLKLVNDSIIGSASEVLYDTTYTFCIRASTITEIADRTFNVIIQGEDAPLFLTPAGLLPVGIHNQLFVIDNSVVDYQLDAIDPDVVAGAKLSYFISSKDGDLPPGLKLTPEGRIVGKVQSVTEIRAFDGLGTYDNGVYDSPYDFAYYSFSDTYSNYISNGGYDFYDYDIVYDYAPDPLPLKSLNRNYEFIVTVSDGIQYFDQRSFQIYVVGDTFFRADTTALISDSGMFTADSSYLRNPVWLTPSDLGMKRANNYVTLMLDVYDSGKIFYRFETTTKTWKPLHTYHVDDLIYVNSKTLYICTTAHTSATTFSIENWHPYGMPPGMQFDERTGEVFGYVPYQSDASKYFKFRVTAYRYGDNFTDVASTSRTFTVNIISEINSVISWNSNSDLGFIDAGYKSSLAIRATSTIINSQITYNQTAGSLPPGLSLLLTGEITGVVNQFTTPLTIDHDDVTFDYNRTSFRQHSAIAGLMSFDFNPTIETTFDDQITTFNGNGIVTFNKYKLIDVGTMSFDYNLDTGTETTFNVDRVLFKDNEINILDQETTLDDDTTTIDHNFTFKVVSTDQYVYSGIEQDFTISVNTPNTIQYSNIYAKPLLSLSQRELWSSFINDPSIFTLDNIYRPSDLNFGVQANLEMLIYAGIETKTASDVYRAISNNFVKKQFRFDGVSKSIAMPLGTSTPLYEVIYITMIDPLELNNTALPNTLTLNNTTHYPSSISIWQDQINNIGSTKGNFLPLWMKSIQPGTRNELGFVLAVPLCYCKVGKADDIILNIKYSNFDFKMINYTIDRFIIDSVTGYNDDKYIIFNHRETI